MHPNIHTAAIYVLIVHPFSHPNNLSSIHPQSYLSNQLSIQPASVYPSILVPSQPYIHSSDEPLFHPLLHPTIHTAAINVLIVHPFSHPNILSSIHPQSYLFNQSFIQVASVYPSILLPSQPYIHSSDESLFYPLMHPNIHTAAIYVLIVHPFSHPNNLSSIHPQSYLSNQLSIQPASVYPSILVPSQPYIHSSDEPLFHPLLHPTIHTAAIYVTIFLPFSHQNILSFIHSQAIYPISNPSNRHQSIHPSFYQVSHTSIHPTNHYFIH